MSGKLTKRVKTALGIAASIESMAAMREPSDLRDAISRLTIIEADAARIQRLLDPEGSAALSEEGRGE